MRPAFLAAAAATALGNTSALAAPPSAPSNLRVDVHSGTAAELFGSARMTPSSTPVRKGVPGGLPTLAALPLVASLGAGGCATVASLSGPLTDGRPLVMSGTRFDLAALDDRERAEARFGTPPPSYPMLDLPFSAALDVLVLGFTVPTAAVLRLGER